MQQPTIGTTMKEQIEKVVKANGIALEYPEQLSSADCIALLNLTSTCRVEMEARREAIWPARTRGSIGPVRAQALKTGTAAEIAALDAESDELEISWQQVKAQAEALTIRREKARDEEAIVGLPTLHAELRNKLDKAEAARNALMVALGELDSGFDAVYLARNRVIKSRGHAAGAEPDTAARLERFALQMDTRRFRSVTQFGKELRETLGIEVSNENTHFLQPLLYSA